MKFVCEIKNRMLLIIIAWLTSVLVGSYYKEVLLYVLVKPILRSFEEEPLYFIFTNVTEVFYTYLDIVFFISSISFLTVSIFHLIKFVLPALRLSECYVLEAFVKRNCIITIIFNVALYKMVVPVSWEFFYSYQNSSLCTTRDSTFKFFLETRIHEYVKFFLFFFFSFNVISQIFATFMAYIEYRNDKLEFMKRNKGKIYFTCFFFSTLITPPDIANQIVWGISLIALFEGVVLRMVLNEALYR